MSIRLSKSCVGEEEKAALANVIDAGYLGMGNEVKLFEQELKEFIGTDKEVICVNTGTAALHLAVLCLDIKLGDEVLVPSLTYIASFQAISATGAKPVACDVCENNVFIDLNDAAKHITSRTKAIMPVHYASDSFQIKEVYSFARKHGLRVIEDAAHSFGCKRDERYIGCQGDIICFSFDGIKNITSGEGGAIVTGDMKLVKRCKDARLLGVEKDTEQRYKGQRSWKFDTHYQGYRYHMSNIMAAIGRVQLKKLTGFSLIRRNIMNCYLREFINIKEIQLLELDYDNIVPHIFVVKVNGGKRDSLVNFLRENNIECGSHYYPNHMLDYFRTSYPLPVTEILSEQLISLPMHARLTEFEQNKVIQAVKDFFYD